MPLYDHICERGHRFERFVPLAEYDKPQSCDCGRPATRTISAPRLLRDHIDPCLGMDGKMHDSLSSLRRTYRADGNPQGENYIELGNEELPTVQYDFDRGKRREAIKRGMADVKAGRIPPVATGDFS